MQKPCQSPVNKYHFIKVEQLGNSLLRSNFSCALTIQALLDEMDKNDQLIGEVYSKGDILLQVISGQSKATVESELNQLEEDWAEFCQETLSVKGVIEETIQMWNEFEENRDKLAEWLGELERDHNEAFSGPANLEALKDKLEAKKVICIFSFN